MEPLNDLNTIKRAPVLDTQALTKDESILKLYANGFQAQISHGDANLLIKQNEVPIALINMSHSNLKSLGNQINNLIDLYKKNSGEVVYSTDEITLRAQKHQTENK